MGMRRDTVELMTPKILVVDDERQIHAALRLRLGRDYELVFCLDAKEALGKIRSERFDLCFTDIHMPRMDGLTFIETAQSTDPCLGHVLLSAFDSHENLRRAIPLQVYDFVTKPLPEREGFEARIPAWIEQTRQRRRDHALATRAAEIASDRDTARLERDVEFVASETARDALLQTANFLTTIHAHLLAAAALVAARAKSDPSLSHLARSLDEARKTADAAMTSAESFFNSAYGSRDSSPALIHDGVRHAIDIAARVGHAESTGKTIDFVPLRDRREVRGLSGIEFLMMMVPAIGVAITSAPPQTTIGIHCEDFLRLETFCRGPAVRDYFWLNRKNALNSHAGTAITIAVSAAPLSRSEIESWLRGEFSPLATIATRGLIAGIQKCQGLLGFSAAPESERFRFILALPD